MTDAGHTTGPIEVRGEICRRLSPWPIRALMIVTGLALVRGLLAFAIRYCLGFRRTAVAVLDDGTLTLDEDWFLFGRRIGGRRTVARLADTRAFRLENRERQLEIAVGFGALAVGTYVGLQWFVDGLRAGYPYLMLVGAGIVAAGVALDVVLYTLVPSRPGSHRLVIALGPWEIRLAGVDRDRAERAMEAFRRTASSSHPRGR